MRNNSFRSRMTTGAFTLPVMAMVTVLLWVLPAIDRIDLWMGLGMIALTAFLLAELNNRNALIRIRSRMVSSTFLALFLACPHLHPWSIDLIPTICLVISYFQLFASYQEAHPEGHVFLGFLFLGIASTVYPPLLFCIPLLYLSLLIPLRSLTWRTFFAGLFGLILPYWFYTGWAIWNEQLDTAFVPFVEAFHFQATNFSAVPSGVLIWFSFMVMLTVCSMIHFAYTAYNDKIRIRMYYYVIITIEVFLLIALFLQPQSYKVLSGLLIANSAPLVAHYFTLGRGRILNYWFMICTLLWGAITLFNTFNAWKLSSTF